MGITKKFAEFLLSAHRKGVSFKRTLTLGRQQWLVEGPEQADLVAKFAIGADAAASIKPGDYADAFFREWLKGEAFALDASDFEGASMIHDLNLPMPTAWDEGFDVVIDGGTLEHVFNFPVAIESCMRVLKVEGTLFLAMPANNFCGHGFYQFSPELVYRVLSEANGFRITRLFLLTHPFPSPELSDQVKIYEMSDPDSIGRRTQLVTHGPVSIFVEAKRSGRLPLNRSWPQQSDYSRTWEKGKATTIALIGNNAFNRLGLAFANRLPRRWRNWIAGIYQRVYFCSLRNRGVFRRRVRPFSP